MGAGDQLPGIPADPAGVGSGNGDRKDGEKADKDIPVADRLVFFILCLRSFLIYVIVKMKKQ